MNTSQRHTVLSKLVKSGRYDSQDDLLAAMHRKGFQMTQATLSRDLGKIGAFKQGGRYYLGPMGYALDGFSKVAEMKYVEPNIILLKTTPGLAQAAALMVDNANVEGIAGTIAGDDTILVVIEFPKLHSRILRRLSQLFARTQRH